MPDKNGKLHEVRGVGTPLPRWFPANEAHLRLMLQNGLIAAVDADGRPDHDRIVECLSALSAVGVPVGCGRPRARDLLARHDLHYSNDTLSKALRLYGSDWKLGEPYPWSPEAAK
ncbi:hypothetical protein ACT16_06110 [Mycobacterium heckeshornense]|nr:hypothetical protein ACT16_06110 [Mycobacterium heckeshornense]